jgi:putative hydrolase of the HAD superfamily
MKKTVCLDSIENIVFDLGGVIMDLDPARTTAAFDILLSGIYAPVYEILSKTGLLTDLQKGAVTPSYFRDQIRSISKIKLSDSEIDDAWNTMLVDIPAVRLQLLDRLAADFNLFLLSNTNQIHYDYFNQLALRNRPGKDISSYFKKTYYSHEIGMQKPDREIYEYIIKDLGIQPDKTLFIDDSKENVDSAALAGLQTLHKPAENEIVEYFNHNY